MKHESRLNVLLVNTEQQRLDSPGCLAMCESIHSVGDPFHEEVRFGKFCDDIRNRGAMHSIISPALHTIARYARQLDDIKRAAAATREVSHAR